MTDIQSTRSDGAHQFGTLNRSASEINTSDGAVADTVYTYIGISEPDRDKSHLYENQSIIDAHSVGTDFELKRKHKEV